MAAAPDSAREDKAKLDAAFTELYKAHLRDVYSYSYYRVGNHHDAEDLTEQTFLQAYRHFERAQRESEGRPLRPWLIRMAHKLAPQLHPGPPPQPPTAPARASRRRRSTTPARSRRPTPRRRSSRPATTSSGSWSASRTC